ncbi:MAG: lysine--tRNA ligase, partial [Thermofilum sp.]
REWMEVAEPEVLRFLYLLSPPMRRVVLSLEEVPSYYDLFDKAERVYFGVEEGEEELKASYRYAFTKDPPDALPFRVRYINAMILSQVLPSRGENLSDVISRLKETKQLTRELSQHELESLRRRIALAKKWLELYAPAHYRIALVAEPPYEKISEVADETVIGLVRRLISNLEELGEWNEGSIKEAMMKLKREREAEQRFFQLLYLSFFGKPSGPRIAPYLAMLNKDYVLERLRKVLKHLEGS